MRKEVLYSLKGIYRENFEIEGYRFGNGEKSACIVGAMRGNEMQQLYICSQNKIFLFSGRTGGCLSDRRWRCTLFPFTRTWKSLPV